MTPRPPSHRAQALSLPDKEERGLRACLLPSEIQCRETQGRILISKSEVHTSAFAPPQCDPALLPEPNHVMLNHLYALSIKVRTCLLLTVFLQVCSEAP